MRESRRRVLIVTRNLPPLVGGMERLNWHLAEQLAGLAEVRLVAPAGSGALAPGGTEVAEVALRPLWRFLLSAGWRARSIARRWRPHVVLAGSGLTAPMAWLAAKACGARAAVYLHGLDIGVRHRLYRLAWVPAIRRMDVVIANSSATRRLALEAGVLESRIAVVPPGVDPPDAQEHAAERAARFRAGHDLGQGPILLSVGRLTERKGLREFVRDVLPSIAAEHPDVRLVVIGEAASDALAARSQSRASILAAAREHDVADCVRFLGVVTDRQALSDAYRSASVHVFPVRQLAGDPEGFGMVAIEAAAHGLATAAYATGGVIDAVAEGVTGRLVPPEDAAALGLAVLDLLAKPLPQDVMRAHAVRFAWPRFGERIADCLLDDARRAGVQEMGGELG